MSAVAALNAALAGRYRIERDLGEGGMASVYLAQDLKHDRKVALKLLKPELAAVLGADRFVVEIKTTAALQHPHILPLFDSGTADGFLFYVMPFIEGETLRDKLNRETQLGVDEAVRIAREVLDALAVCARARHRAPRREAGEHPAARRTRDGGGLRDRARSERRGGRRMTQTGLSLGTPHYMSPEQAMAEKQITARTDIYSLGAVMYEMLTGDPPFTGALRAADHHEDHHRAGRAGDEATEVGAAERRGRGGEVAGEAAGRSLREREGVQRGARELRVHERDVHRCRLGAVSGARSVQAAVHRGVCALRRAAWCRGLGMAQTLGGCR